MQCSSFKITFLKAVAHLRIFILQKKKVEIVRKNTVNGVQHRKEL